MAADRSQCPPGRASEYDKPVPRGIGHRVSETRGLNPERDLPASQARYSTGNRSRHLGKHTPRAMATLKPQAYGIVFHCGVELEQSLAFQHLRRLGAIDRTGKFWNKTTWLLKLVCESHTGVNVYGPLPYSRSQRERGGCEDQGSCCAVICQDLGGRV